MNTINKIRVLLLTLILLTPMLTTAQSGGSTGVYSNQLTLTSLTTVEQENIEQESTLLWMREEEKVARDVYLTLYTLWKKPVFTNIADSEQGHMDALLKKIELFGLSDPVIPGVGNFYDTTLQNLYDQQIAEGMMSYIDALRVGATIEDMDIRDLKKAITETDNLAMQTTYESLLEGSKNHLRAFVSLLQQQSEVYIPMYIDQELFDAILTY